MCVGDTGQTGNKQKPSMFLSVEIMIEIINHLGHYKQYGNKKDMTTFLAKCVDYFQKRVYDSDAVNICIGATANALGINVHVLQKSNDKKRVHMSSFLCLHSSSMDIYLHYYPGKSEGKILDAHFNCYVNKDYYKKNSKSIASHQELSGLMKAASIHPMWLQMRIKGKRLFLYVHSCIVCLVNL